MAQIHPEGALADLIWDPSFYASCCGVPDPFRAYRLEQHLDRNLNFICEPPLWNDPGWVTVGDYQTTSATVTIPFQACPNPHTVADCVSYALRLVYDGPDNRNSRGEALGELVTVYRSATSVVADCSVSLIQDFAAEYAGRNRIEVRWVATLESDLAGYRVERALGPGGAWEAITEFIPARGDGTLYVIYDKVNRGHERTFHYRLQLVGKDGSVKPWGAASASLPSKARASS